MGFKVGFLFLAILAVGLADPIRNLPYDGSYWFLHANPESRVVGGTPAAEGSVPYMVAMTEGIMIRSFLCGGSVVSPRTILTAAHCITAVFSTASRTLLSSLRVTVGTNRWNSGGQTYLLQRNLTHPNYDESIMKNDIGLLITTTSIVYSATVQPAVWSYDFVDEKIVGRAAGWGTIRFGGGLSAVLLELYVTTVDGQRCAEELERVAEENGAVVPMPPLDTRLEICAFHSMGHGMCNGDSGSALVRVDRQQQVGIVSWAVPCALGAPDVFVRVSAYREWLEQSIV